MFKSLKIEWMKIKNYRVFQVFSVLYLLGIIVIIYAFYQVYMQLTGRLTGRDSEDIFRLFSADTIWRTVGFSTGFLLYLPGMVIINLFTNEVNFKTHRQNIIDGWTRETFIYTKVGLIAFTSFVVVIMNIIATILMCSVTKTPFSIIDGLPFMGLIFLQAFVYLMFALLLATLFRRSGVAVIVFFIYGLLLEILLVGLFSWVAPGAQHFLFLQVADSLIPFTGMDGWFSNPPSTLVAVITALIFAGVYIYFTIRKYKYDDL